MKSIRFKYVWWYYNDDAEDVHCFVFNKDTTKILDIETEKIYEIDPKNVFKSVKAIYGNKGRIDDTYTILDNYIFRNNIGPNKNYLIFDELYNYVGKHYLKEFTERFKKEIKGKQQEVLDSLKNNDELVF